MHDVVLTPETDPDPRMLVEFSWLEAKRFISGAVKKIPIA